MQAAENCFISKLGRECQARQHEAGREVIYQANRDHAAAADYLRRALTLKYHQIDWGMNLAHTLAYARCE